MTLYELRVSASHLRVQAVTYAAQSPINIYHSVIDVIIRKHVIIMNGIHAKEIQLNACMYTKNNL